MESDADKNQSRRLVAMAILAVVAVVGAWMRWRVLTSALGDLNGDEATMGVVALDIRHGALPIVLAGQAYTAVLESYPVMLLTSLFGPHPTMLKLVAVGFWALAAALVVGAASQIVHRRSAWLAGALVWLAPGALLVISTRAYPGYCLGLAAVSASYWATGLVLSAEGAATRRSALAGAAAGLAFYIHPMFLSVVVPHIGMAAWHHRRDVRQWWVPALGAALVVNIPFLGWSAANGLSAFDNDTAQPGTYLDRLRQFGGDLLPRAFGLVGPDGAWVVGRLLGVGLYVVIAAGTIVGGVRLARGTRGGRSVAVATVLVWPLMALFSAHGYVADGRYAIIPFVPIVLCLVSATEALIASVGSAAQKPSSVTVAAGVIAVWVGFLVVPYLGEVVGRTVDDPNPVVTEAVGRLEAAGVNRVTGSYWLVQPLSVWTGGAIVTKPTWPQPVRSERQADIVDSSAPDTVAHLFQAGKDWVWTLSMPTENYRREEFGGVILYLPIDQE